MTQRLTQREKRGLTVLLGLILLLVAARVLLLSRESEQEVPMLSAEAQAELETFDSLVAKTQHANLASPPAPPCKLFDFDPNSADSATFRQLGLPTRLVNNALAYRSKGGCWRKPDDFRRLYGMTDELFEQLKPYIKINAPSTTTHAPKSSAVQKPGTLKFDSLTVLNLNQVDTLTLQRIPGIGPYFSRAIVNYRKRLGGFVHVHQLHDIEGLPTDITSWFAIAPGDSVQTIAINEATFKTLLRHPYLNYEQVKAIASHRQKRGAIVAWTELLMYDVFSHADVERLRPYFTFNTTPRQLQQKPSTP